ncbi:MAG: SRPBCC family protein [Rhodoferax sp.]|jgi:hypothetical protein
MSAMDFSFTRVATATVRGTVGEVFALLDDHKRLAAHMEKPSLMMAGARMEIETDNRRGQALGSEIRLHGRVLGIPISVTEKVVDFAPPFRKIWETTSEPKLLVIGRYRMGVELTPIAQAVQLRVWIEYDLPTGWFTRLLGRILGGIYAQWCLDQMLRDASHVV